MEGLPAVVKDIDTQRNFDAIKGRLANAVAPVAVLEPTASLSTNQQIINRAAGKGPVYAPAGVYKAGLSLPSNTTLFGTGWQTIFKVADSTSSPYALVNSDQTNGNTNIHLSNFAVDGNKASSGETSAGQVIMTAQGSATCTNCTVENVYAYNAKQQGIIFVNVKGGAIRNNLVTGNDRDGITCYFNCEQIAIHGNRVVACNDDSIALNAENGKSEGHAMQGISVYGNQIFGPAPNKGSYGAISCLGIRGCAIVGNLIDSPKERGISLLDYNNTPVGDVLIADNIIKQAGLNGEGTFRPAIGLYAGLLGKAGINDVTISGNHIREPATYGISMQSDIGGGVVGVQHINVIGNFIDRAGLDGILLNDSIMRDIAIRGNIIHDGEGSGIKGRTFTSQLQRIWCNDNTVFNNKERGIWLEGITAGTVLNNSATNQEASKPQAYGISLASLAATWRIGQNIAFNNATKDYDLASIGTPEILGAPKTASASESLALVKEETKTLPGTEKEVTQTGWYVITGVFDFLCEEAGFNASGRIVVNGAEQSRRAIFAGTAANQRATVSTFSDRVLIEAGQKVRLGAQKSGGKYTANLTHSSILISPVS